MRSIIQPGVEVGRFLEWAVADGYSMQNPFIEPEVGKEISAELAEAGFLEDLTELESTDLFDQHRMKASRLLHRILNGAICKIEGKAVNHLPLFSVRVFEPGEYATTVHRNHPSIGPWAVGITLKGEAPFNVYDQSILPNAWNQTVALVSEEQDPIPRESMNANAGSAWTLYTKNELIPHSGGLVRSETQRELLILYGEQ